SARPVARPMRGPRVRRVGAAALPAVAGRARRIYRVVAPLAGDVLGPDPDAALVHDAAADAGAEDHPEDHRTPLPRPGSGLGEREAVGVVLEKHPQTEAAFQIGLQRPAVEARGVGVLERAVACRERARRPDADDVATRCRSPQRSHHPRHPLDDVLVAALALGRQPAALQWMEVVAEHHTLDLRAAEVDPDDHRGLGLPHAARSHVFSPGRSPCPTLKAASCTTPTRTWWRRPTGSCPTPTR